MKHGMRILLKGNGHIIEVKRTYTINAVLGTSIFTSLSGTEIVVAHDMYEIVEKF